MADDVLAARRAHLSAAAVLSDLDGTLIDSAGPADRVWTAFAVRHGLDPATVRHFAQGKPSRETVAQLAPDADPRQEARRLEAAELADTEGVTALAGAAAILAGPPPAVIVTSCSRALADARLAAAGLPAPEIVVCADDIRAGKPDPEGFALAASRLGVAPADCVVLEDAPAGVRAGVSSGAVVIALVQTHTEDELRAAGANWVLDTLASLVPAR